MKNVTRFWLFLLALMILLPGVMPAVFAQALTGTKTIGGTSPDFPTIKAAIQALNVQGTGAPGVTFLIRSGTYAEDSLRIRTATSSAAAPIVFKPDVGATVVVDVAPPNTTYNFAMKIDTTVYVTIDGSNNGTTSRDMTINATGTNGQRGVWVSGASHYATIKNCNITAGRDIASPTTAVRGIDFLYTGVAQDPDFVLAENNVIRYAYTGIRMEGNAAGDVMESPVVRNNVIDSVGNAGIYTLYHNDASIAGNDVNIMRGSSATIYGIFVGSTTARTRVSANKVHDIVQLSTTSITYAIYASGTSTLAGHAVFNNFVWAVSSPTAATGAIYGIYDGIGNTTIADTIAYNSVNLTGSSTGNKTTAAFYKGSATGPAYVYNNVLQNTRTDGTTGVAVAIYKTSAATALNSNNNNFYVGAPDAQHSTGRISTTNYATIADWRIANASDAVSVAENSPFVSATNLHMQTGIPSQLESGGTPIAGITADIDSDTRNATTPDIGADEFAGTALDLVPPVISYIPLGPTFQTASRSITATITDASGVPITGIGLPVLYWRINSGTYTGATGVYVSGNSYSFTLGSGVATGDTVSYFVAAQDNAAIPNVAVLPAAGAGGFTPNPPAASTPPTSPSSYLIVQPPLVAGDYTVGLTLFEKAAGKQLIPQTFTRKVMREVPVGPEINFKQTDEDGLTSFMTPYRASEMRAVDESYSMLMENGRPYNGPTRVTLTDAQRTTLGLSDNILAVYPTLTAAVSDLNLRGVSGSVRFLLVDATYPTETFPITIRVASDSVPTASKTVTIKPSTGITATVAGASASGRIFQVVNTSYVTIDGSNTNGGTTQDLTIQNTSATAPSVVLFGSLGTTPITNCVLKNAVVINGINSSTPIIVSDGATAGNPGYFSDITIQNNVIRNGYHAIYCNAFVAALNGANFMVNSNTIGATATDSVRYDGVYIQGADGAIVRGNDIGGFSTVTSEVDRGVWLASGTKNTLVEKNTIHDMLYGGTSGYAGKGVVVSSGLANCNNTVQNNMIYNLTGDGDSYTSFGATYAPNGIFAFGAGQTGVNIHYNSIYLYGNSINNDAQCYSIGIALDDGTVASVLNNLIVNNLGLRASTGVGPVAIAAEVSNSQFSAINYNDYYTNAASPAVNNVGKIAATDYPTLAAWAVASGGDANSISADVAFSSLTNLHINPAVPSPVDSAATPIVGVADDFDGNVRNATRPDIGADEFALIVLPPPVVGSVTRSTRVPVAADTVGVRATITDTLGITSANLLYTINGGTVQSVPMTLTSGTPQNGSYAGTIPGTANADGNRIEYRIQASSSTGLTTTTSVTANNSYFAGVSPLSSTGVKAVSGTRQLLYANYYARITGTINGPNFQTTNLGYNLQDAFGGINLFKSGTITPALALGDSVIVLGKLAQFRGLTEITPDTVTVDIQIVATGRPLTVVELTVPNFNANPELYESRLLRFTNLRRRDATPPWPLAGSSANIVMYQGTTADTIIMRIDSDTEVDGSPEPTYPVNVAGVITQFTSISSLYNDGYQTQPRYLTDFTTPAAGLAGNYNIGAGGQFPTLDSAFSALNTQGVSGPVTFSLTDSVYRPVGGVSNGDAAVLQGEKTSEMDPLDPLAAHSAGARLQRGANTDGEDLVGQINIIGPITGASATNRVTVRPATGVRARIVGTGTATFNFSNASFVTFDGIGTTGSTQLSVENSASGGVAFALLGNSDNNVLQNMTIRSPYVNGICVYADTGSGAATDSNQILNNLMPIGSRGVYLRGGNFVAYGNRIVGNTIGGDSISALGIYNQQVNGSVIANNLIRNVIDGTAAGGNIAGIWVATKQLKTHIYNNVITGIRNRPGATAAVFVAGLYYFGTAGDTSRSRIYNNMVYDLDNKSTSATSTVRGLYISTGILDTVAYNSVYVTGTDAGTALSSAINVGSAVLLTMRNNNLAVTRTATGTGRTMALYALTTTSTYTSNRNNLYVTPAQAGSHVAGVSTTNYTTLAAWQVTGRDSQSVSVMPNFQAPDLHINKTLPTPINGGGTPIAGITTDIDGQPRNGATPDIGADEFSVGFFDDFEAYTVGQRLACQNPVDWTTWSNLPCNTTEDPLISSAFAFSGTKSVVITENNDLVRKHANDTTGIHIITFKFYVPSSKAGYFNTLATYSLPSTFNWAMEAYFDSAASGNNGRLLAGSATAIPFSYTHNAWHTVRLVVNLNIDSARFYINGSLIRTWRWTAGASGGTSPRRLAANDFFGATAWDQMYMDDYDVHPDTIWTGVNDRRLEIPEAFALMQNYPNPFNPTTTMSYTLPRDAHVTLSIYNILGQRVAMIKDEVQRVGYHEVLWNGRNDFGSQVASGIYFYRLDAKSVHSGDAFSSIKKMLMLK